jgi:hypothetical protein
MRSVSWFPRYAPYPALGNHQAAAAAALAAAAAAAPQQSQPGGLTNAHQAAAAYSNYALPATVDMSAFQGLDWSAMAGLPAMYAA